jgi:hypothetical protein
MGGTKGGGSTRGQGMFAQNTGPQNMGSQNSLAYIIGTMMGLPPSRIPGNTQSGTGSKGSQQPQQPQQPAAALPPMPEYVNYQQTPSYGTQPVGPSQAILDFMGGQYASGGSVNERSPDDEIAAALRIVRLLGGSGDFE